MTDIKSLPVVIIGAGPIGLAAAAHLIARKIPVRIFEAGDGAGASISEWQHVRLFSPWRYNVDDEARALLEKNGWREPNPDAFPTGSELLALYVRPLAEVPEIARALETNTRVSGMSRSGMDKVTTKGRDERPFSITLTTKAGHTERALARAVIDASGTWRQPNPLGADGLPASGEVKSKDLIAYGIPDVLARDRAVYENRKVVVIGAGHSAANALIDLVTLRERAPRTQVTWVTRSGNLARVYGGGSADQLAARGELGDELKSLTQNGKINLIAGFPVVKVSEANGNLLLLNDEDKAIGPFDRVIVATGQRPDLSFLREIRVSIDEALECATALAPLIDPNVHSCGSVRPHGHRQLSHPEPDFYTIGVKSYGRAPTFLLLTGHEQARSVAAAIAGDMASADKVNLILPETGVCSVPKVASVVAAASCCGGPAITNVSACCADDEAAKTAGKSGCGCSTANENETRVREVAS